ncbi:MULTISPECIES: hypothetical protein [unclassified Prochlorococcus]|uniref:hypothetical protein n=1 Tax=unclassified Prochlorococcus TaxID=2627481 RepID=UPI000533708C|nr:MULTISPECIES: hypothetical protein [unclassified Prochlorococcus]KGG28521.1 hypothetical protein EV12_0608 [Prochlorococcus sp. MIT 0701]KGG28934.1 hypothetical protein EV13_1448 [Prochlorococcus sp. MIT 0702]KGG37134.1 hypothetical protein EV14_0076 [Prochlorococcus sp. MIT 0703]
MTDFNTDYNNTELLDQELTTTELSEVSGGLGGDTINPDLDPGFGGMPAGIIFYPIARAAIDLFFPQLLDSATSDDVAL